MATALLLAACMSVGVAAAQSPARTADLERADARARQQARALLERQPDHAGARAVLGYRWHTGRWRLPEEIAHLERAARRSAVATAPPAAVPAVAPPTTTAGDAARIDRLRGDLVLADETRARAARAVLLALAERTNQPKLRDDVEREFWRARHAWSQAGMAVGILEVRVQHVSLIGMDTVTVGFGNGTGRLQLPRTESISFQGAVALPFGGP